MSDRPKKGGVMKRKVRIIYGMGSFLRDHRKLAGLTMDGLAQASGVCRLTVFNVENGRQDPSITTVDKLLKPLGWQVVLTPIDEDSRLDADGGV